LKIKQITSKGVQLLDTRVLKENDLFLLTNKEGNIPSIESELGLYTKDTRFLSTYEFSLEGIQLCLLSSEAERSFVGNIRLTNNEVKDGDNITLWRESIAIKRKRFLYQDVFYERISLQNFNQNSVSLNLKFKINADFRDMFEVRGYLDGTKGIHLPPKNSEGAVSIGYEGSDGVNRRTVIEFSQKIDNIDENGIVSIPLDVLGEKTATVDLVITPIINNNKPVKLPFDEAYKLVGNSYQNWIDNATKVKSDSEVFNQIYKRSLQDIRCLLTDLGDGPFPVAGIPWFAVPFGRDSLIAALQMLSIHPEVARGTLRILAKHQGEKEDSWRDEQPGKILHEIRYGELANNNDIPHTPYYGSIDSTPLFLVLAVEYYRWTGDKDFIIELLPNIKMALDWIDKYGDRDQDGFVEYFKESSKGIDNQAWKDSADSVVHKSGELAKAPISIAEVQGYVYDAKNKLANVFEELGESEYAVQLANDAARIKERFAKEFWLEGEQFVAIALDYRKEQVESITTNPGHCLWSGLLSEEQATKVVQRLVSKDMFSGFGIRTMSTESARYNPMSYHDGSVWPHDNSIVFLGMKNQGFHDEAMQVIDGLLRAATYFEYYRLPELFCGFSSEDEPSPVPYPVACSPQAWAAGTTFMMLQAMLGIAPNVSEGKLEITPSLPSTINYLDVEDLKIGEGTINIRLKRDELGRVTMKVLQNTTGLKISVPSNLSVLCNS
jgi:glycogen debranching enzyme